MRSARAGSLLGARGRDGERCQRALVAHVAALDRRVGESARARPATSAGRARCAPAPDGRDGRADHLDCRSCGKWGIRRWPPEQARPPVRPRVHVQRAHPIGGVASVAHLGLLTRCCPCSSRLDRGNDESRNQSQPSASPAILAAPRRPTAREPPETPVHQLGPRAPTDDARSCPAPVAGQGGGVGGLRRVAACLGRRPGSRDGGSWEVWLGLRVESAESTSCRSLLRAWLAASVERQYR